MTSLAEREGLWGKVQCIYMDPPYGFAETLGLTRIAEIAS